MSKKKNPSRSGGLNNNNQQTVTTHKRFIKFLNEKQKEAWDTYNENSILFLTGPAGSGKSFLSTSFAINEILSNSKDKIYITRPLVEAGESMGFLPGPQPLNAKILTPSGWKKMGDLQIGDLVIQRNGQPTKIINIIPQGIQRIYKITTDDDVSTEATETHLWTTVNAHNFECNTLTTGDILCDLEKNIDHFLPINEVVNFNLDNNPSDCFQFGMSINDKTTKIPNMYKYTSSNNRKQLLEGFLTIQQDIQIKFAKTANDIAEIIRSLGQRCTIIKLEDEFKLNINLENNIRELVKIKSIKNTGKNKQVQCLVLDSEEHLYITDNYIVTHNSVDEKTEPFLIPIFDCISKICGPKDVGIRSLLEKKVEIAPLALMRGRSFDDAVCILDEAQNCTKGQLKLFLTRIGENCKMIITGDLTQSDLFEDPDLRRVLVNLEGIKGIGHIHFDDCHIVRNPIIAEIIKRI